MEAATIIQKESIIRTLGKLITVLVLLLPLHSYGACKEELADIDGQMASGELNMTLLNAMKMFRDQAAAYCERGQEATAMQTLGYINMMLAQVEAEQSNQTKGVSQAQQTEVAAPPAPADLLKHYAGPDFPNRWDKLSQIDYCQWLTPDELARELSFHEPLECRKTRQGFRYELPHHGDDWPVAFMLIVEVHPGQETVRRAEANTSEGFSKRLFTPFDAGTPELNIYVSNKGHYLYAFPAAGLTLWRLEYIKESPRRDQYYSPTPGRSGNADLGPRFMEILVDKYKDLL